MQGPPPPTGLASNNSSLTNKLLSARSTQAAPQSKPLLQQQAVPANVKSIVQRPTPVAPAKPSSAAPAANTNGSSTSGGGSAQSSIPSKPPIQPRQPRGPPVAPAASNEKLGVKPESLTSKSPAPVGAKAPTPATQANGKPTPTAPANKDKLKPAFTAAAVAGKKENTVGNGPNGTKEEAKSDVKVGREDEKKGGGEKEQSASDIKDKDGKDERAPPPKRHSLYIKGIPVPTSEDELKALFPDAAKVNCHVCCTIVSSP